MPIAKETILRWLREGGLPLEYDAARYFRGMGFRAEQGRHYQDPMADGPKTREADVVATLLLTMPEPTMVAVIECKSAKDKPWVILTTEIGPREPWRPIATSRVVGAFDRHANRAQQSLQLTRPYGFSMIEASERSDRDEMRAPRRERRDRAHDALEQVVSAAVGLLPRDGLTFHLPVIVTDAPIWALAPDPTGALDANEVESYRILWHGAQAHPMPTVVDVVSRHALQSHAERLRHELQEAAETIFGLIEDEPPLSGIA